MGRKLFGQNRVEVRFGKCRERNVLLFVSRFGMIMGNAYSGNIVVM